MVSLRRPLAALLAAAAVAGCSDHGKAAETHATTWVAEMAKRAAGDVKDLEVGLPRGATDLTPVFAAATGDNQVDLQEARKVLKHMRAAVPELMRSSSTFFAISDAKGVALRNDLDQDLMAGQDLWKQFPDLKRTADAPFVTATGLFTGVSSPEPDRDWIGAVPVKDAKGAFVGMLLGGWRMQRFAYHMQEWMRHDLTEAQAKTSDPGKLPIAYVAVFDSHGVYCAPQTPSVNQKALGDLGLEEKTASGTAHGVLSITDRDFGYAATRVPALGADVGVVVLWSDV